MSIGKKKGFTLIELIAVLVILAILALIVTPLVMNIIRKAKVSADRRSVDAYGRSVELAIATHLLDTGTFPTDLKNLNVEYTGKVVVCNVMQMKENGGIYLSECTVGTKEVKDSSTEDGWYHYGTRDLTNEEYVDMYGLALKNASVAYYESNGTVVEDYRSLTVDYKGKPVSCDVTVYGDGEIFLTACKVNNVIVTNNNEEDNYYHYGIARYNQYNIGDEITYKQVKYYVIKKSDENESTVTMLKADPLTVNEVNLYGGFGTDNSHINVHVRPDGPITGIFQKVYNYNGYGGIVYYSSEDCGFDGPTWNNGIWITDGCTNDYEQSEIKYVVDNWATSEFELNILKEARLITFDELINYLNFESHQECTGACSTKYSKSEYTPSWVYGDYWYWTMSQSYDNTSQVWIVGYEGDLHSFDILHVGSYGGKDSYDSATGVIRPVITIKKRAIN